MTQKEILVSEESLYKGQILTLKKAKVRLEDGSLASREIVHTTGAAAILALDIKTHKALFVSQYRTPIAQATLELPAGRIEQGELPLETARRELNEEAGLAANTWQKLSAFYQSAGFSDAQTTLFLAADLTKLSDKRPQDQGEFVKSRWLTLAQAKAAQKQGLICDAKSTIGLLLWAGLLKESENA